MATHPRHKKAKMLRDFMIAADMINLFQEDEQEDTIFFRTAYPMQNDNKQLVLSIDDTVYLGVQTLLFENVPEEKIAEVLSCINDFNLQFPTLKYVLTKDKHIITTMFFTADESFFNVNLIFGTTIQMMKNIGEMQYGKLKSILE
jgi:hypothetical protein